VQDNQDIVVSAVNKLWDRRNISLATFQDALVHCKVPSAVSNGIIVALKVSSPPLSSQLPPDSKQKEDFIEIEVRLKK